MTNNAPSKKGFVKFIPYLTDVGITSDAYLNRVRLLYELCSDICPEEIEDMFVEDYIKEDGTREYDDISFFSKTYVVGAYKFLTQIKFAISPIAKRLTYLNILVQEFDFQKASEKSRINVGFKTVQGIDGNYKAAKKNCIYLQAIINKYFKPNLIT